ncbi:mannose-1-phosphate guanylyltransferase [Clostridium sp.]|uniref:mannose-1-phosphate guanylyltransferase n=1 Tax=Clostridium sp. TaxID=1506 RepID=UPI002603892E|nr:mannose-1-phosphate guanylyltransferase [Clostridium sp.]
MKIIILAGGGGSRLFPLSRTCFPKQFLNLGSEKSLLVQTVSRFLSLVKPKDIVIVTNKEYYHHVKTELASCGAEDANVLLEPVGRNTAPAIALAVKFCEEKLLSNPGEVLFIIPSDHIIKPIEDFVEVVKTSHDMAIQNMIVTLGIKPDKPETGYGYIQTSEKYQSGFWVRSFKEKPDMLTAQKYLEEGNYFWNSGMFAFTLECIKHEFNLYQPEISNKLNLSLAQMTEIFNIMPNISFDYAILEKSDKVVTIPFTAYWNDIGSWDAMYDILDKDENGNAVKGDCISVECRSTLMLGHSHLIAAINLENLLIVESDDVIVVAKKGESQKVKTLVEELKKRDRREVYEHTAKYHS